MDEELMDVETIPQDVVDEVQEDAENEKNIEPEQPTRQSFKVKHLKEEKEISYDEAPEYIQKGLDYDRVREKYDETKPVLGFVEKLAKQNNMSVQEYMQEVERYEREQAIQDIADNNQLSKEMAEELFLLREERKTRAQKDEEAKREAEKKEEYLSFVNEFPNVDVDSIPVEVFELKHQNPRLTLTDAYIRHQWNEQKKAQQVQQANEKNASTSTGRVANDSGSNDVLTFEKVANMDPKELNKRWEEVRKLYKMK